MAFAVKCNLRGLVKHITDVDILNLKSDKMRLCQILEFSVDLKRLDILDIIDEFSKKQHLDIYKNHQTAMIFAFFQS